MGEKSDKKLKRIVLIIIAVLLVGGGAFVAFTILANKEKPTEVELEMTVVTTIPEIMVSFPLGYERKSNDVMNEIFIRDKSSIIITKEENESEPNGYADAAVLKYMGISDKFELINGYSVMIDEINSTAVREFNYHIKGTEDDLNMTCFAAYIWYDEAVYILTCVSPEEEYETQRKEFEAVLNNIYFEKH